MKTQFEKWCDDMLEQTGLEHNPPRETTPITLTPMITLKICHMILGIYPFQLVNLQKDVVRSKPN